MISKIFSILIIGLFSSFTYAAGAKRTLASVGIKSKDDVVFYDKTDVAFSDMGKIDEFQGILVQQNQTKTDLAQADLYLFDKEDKIAVTNEICQKYVTKIFGPANKRKLQAGKSLQIFKSHTGHSCDFTLKDPQAHASIPNQYGLVGFLNGHLITLIWQLDQPVTDEVRQNFRKFWDKLR